MKFMACATLILLTSTIFAQESPAERIAPYLTDTAVAVGRIDLESLDIDAVHKRLQPFIDAVGRNSDQIKEMISRVAMFRGFGFKEIFLVLDLAELDNDGGYLVVPIPDDVEPPKPGNEKYETIVDSTLIFGSPAIIEYFNNAPAAAERPGLDDAFAAVAEAPIQVVIAPTADQRQVLREMLPDLSGDYGDVSGGRLAAGLKWAALEFQTEPILAASLSIQSDTEQAAAALKQVITAGLREASANKQVLALFPTAPKLVDSLIPEQESSRLIINADELLKITSETFGKLADAARQDAYRDQTTKNLKQLGLAMHNFHDTYRGFPSSASYSADGKPLLSWRVFLLPYLEAGNLYEQFHLDEPWDSEHNKQFIEKMPDVFKSSLTPAEPGMTVFQVPTGKGLIFDGKVGKTFREITDGTSNTMMIVETTAEAAVPWTKPDDLEVDPKNPLAGLAGDREGFGTIFADGSARFISDELDPEIVYDAMTRAGGEIIRSEDLQPVMED